MPSERHPLYVAYPHLIKNIRPFQGSWYLNGGSNIRGLDKSGFSWFSLIECLDGHVCSHALIIHSVYKGKLFGAM